MKKARFYAGFRHFTGLSWMSLDLVMVEAAGIEPASERLWNDERKAWLLSS